MKTSLFFFGQRTNPLERIFFLKRTAFVELVSVKGNFKVALTGLDTLSWSKYTILLYASFVGRQEYPKTRLHKLKGR